MGTDSESSSKPRSATKLIDGGSSSSSDDERPASGYHYFALFILCIINLLNFMDRYTVAAVLTDIQDYYSINDSEAGLLQTVFIVFYTIFAPICGYLGDRYNRKWIMTVGICVWSGAVLSSTFIPKEYFVVFLVLRGIVGIGEASYSTCSPTLIADMFTGKRRSRALMLFYFAIPVGSGLGFIVGENLASLLGAWQWGMRMTPILGVVCLVLIIFFLREPQRGEAEHASVKRTSYWQDIKYLLKNRTYVNQTISYTSVVFVTGSLTWWAPTAVEHAWAMNNDKQEATKDAKSDISLVFGVITCLGGFLGVTVGSSVALMWRDGRGCFKRMKNPRADPYICAIGSLAAVPFMFAALQLFAPLIVVAWVSVFLAVTMMCLNWAIIVDVLLYVIVPTRRATASAIQIMFSHLFGDAISPYIIGVVSDGLRGSDNSAEAHYYSLQHAFYIPTFVLIISGAFFLVSSFYIVEDRRRASEEMHGAAFAVAVTAESGSATNSTATGLPG